MDKDNLNGIPEEEIIKKCSYCGGNKAAEGSEYCEACEKKLLAKRVPFMGWVAGFVSLSVAVVLSIAALSGTLLTSGANKGDEYAKKGNWHAAYEQYYEGYRLSVERINVINDSLNRIFETEERAYINPSLGLKKRMINVVANYYGPLDAYYYATGFLSERELAMPFMKDYEKMHQAFQTTYMTVEETFNKSFEENPDYKTILAEMDKYAGKEGVDDVFLNYHKYVIAVNLGAPVSEQLEILRNIEKLAAESGDDYDWLCNPTMAQTLYDAGEIDETMVYLEKIIESNKSNYEAYRLKMKIQVMAGDIEAAGKTVAEFRENHENNELSYYADVLEIEYLRFIGEYDKAEALCIEADESYKNVPETNGMMDLIYMIENKLVMPTEIYRQRALILMINGEYAEAFDCIMEAYRMESYYAQYLQGTTSLNDPKFYGTLYLSAVLVNNNNQVTEENQPDVEMVLEMFGKGSISEKIDAVKNGEKTVKEVLEEGEFEPV